MGCVLSLVLVVSPLIARRSTVVAWVPVLDTAFLYWVIGAEWWSPEFRGSNITAQSLSIVCHSVASAVTVDCFWFLVERVPANSALHRCHTLCPSALLAHILISSYSCVAQAEAMGEQLCIKERTLWVYEERGTRKCLPLQFLLSIEIFYC